MSAPCDRPIGLAPLLDYWLEDAEPGDVDAVEEHLLGCEACSRLLGSVVAIGGGVRRLSREGAVEMVVTPSFLARIAEQGLHTREYRVAPGGRVDCTVTPQDDILVARLLGNFGGLTRLDLITDQEGQPTHRVLDVPFNSEVGELIVAQAMPYVRKLRDARLQIRLVSPEATGDRLIGAYTFDHTPTPA
jgi:hypothetical protein